MPVPELIREPAEWQRRCRAAREAGRRIALVPTMGYLHEGHLSLMRGARRRADENGAVGLSLATIFVNPAQFGPSEDLGRYPSDLEGDLSKCAQVGVDWVLSPSPRSMYPPGFQTWVEVTEVSQGLCGARRPGHFRGVATVVAKLFGLSLPHVAIFGEKDWQQLQVIRALVRDLHMDLEVAGLPTIREKDGLALSSRNAYLSPPERLRAVAISRQLFDAQQRAAQGDRDAPALAARAAAKMAEAGLAVDYVEVVHPETLRPVECAEPGSRMLAAAFAGKTRLIDNVALP